MMNNLVLRLRCGACSLRGGSAFPCVFYSSTPQPYACAEKGCICSLFLGYCKYFYLRRPLSPLHLGAVASVFWSTWLLGDRSETPAWLRRSLASCRRSRARWTLSAKGGARSSPPFRCTRQVEIDLHYGTVVDCLPSSHLGLR